MTIHSVNPATGDVLRSFEELTDSEIEVKLQRSADAFRSYRRTSFADRAKWMTRAAGILESEKAEFGRLMTAEMGKPYKAAIEEAAKCATACRYYAENAERFLSEYEVTAGAGRNSVRFQPIGAVLAVMPWNFPFWQVFRFIAPTLMAGNTGLLKHASNVPQCALQIEEIVRRAGFPDDVFQTLLVSSSRTGAILDDRRVAAATLTGSEPAGSEIASRAGKQIKKTVLELGGSDPFVVMPDADLGEAVRTAVRSRTINNGQSCISAKRFIVDSSVYDAFEKRFVEQMRALVVGDPMDAATDVGPLATPKGAADLGEQIARAVAAGATTLTGGRRIEGPGNYFEPTVLRGVTKASPVFYEELFGPVAMLFRVQGIDEAIGLANDSPFGLGASVWTNDRAAQERFIDEIEAGMVFVNGMVASDARLPFGGVKTSGYGREMGPYGILEFVNIKTVCIKSV